MNSDRRTSARDTFSSSGLGVGANSFDLALRGFAARYVIIHPFATNEVFLAALKRNAIVSGMITDEGFQKWSQFIMADGKGKKAKSSRYASTGEQRIIRNMGKEIDLSLQSLCIIFNYPTYETSELGLLQRYSTTERRYIGVLGMEKLYVILSFVQLSN